MQINLVPLTHFRVDRVFPRPRGFESSSLTTLPSLLDSPHRTRLKLTCLLTAALVVITGCSSSSTDTSSTPTDVSGDADRPRIALVMKSLANEFFSTMADGAKEHQAENSDTYDLFVNGIKDERDLSRQVALVEEMVASGVDAIVIAPADSKALVPALRRAKNQGVSVINIDNRLDTEILAKEEVQIPFVGPDNLAGAKAVGDFLANKLSSDSKVAILEGIRTSFNAQQRLKGFEAAMKDAGIEIVDSQSAEWEMSRANTIASSMLSEHPEIDAILCANDSMALGAIAAVKNAAREGEVLIVGFDNITAIQQAIQDKKVLATADQHGDQLAIYGIEAALQSVIDGTEPTDVETPVDLITADTLGE